MREEREERETPPIWDQLLNFITPGVPSSPSNASINRLTQRSLEYPGTAERTAGGEGGENESHGPHVPRWPPLRSSRKDKKSYESDMVPLTLCGKTRVSCIFLNEWWRRRVFNRR